MSLNHAVASGLRCNGCRYAVIRSFASISGVNLPLRDHSTSCISTASLGQRRTFRATPTHNFPRKTRKSTSNDPFNEEDGLVEGANGPAPEGQEPVPIAWHLHEAPSTHQMPPADLREDVIEKKEVTEEEELASLLEAHSQPAQPVDPNVPWYLQVQRPRDAFDESQPLAHRQRIPELPKNPPPMLEEILQRISVDLGLDDLNLLDLRHLDPPPALGSKLIMIVGTARSEKHLHVSADRFSRWLRSTHKLKPHAAGLLGRNELKLKLRRKARRMRLLANVGGQEMDDKNIDDGIRTGWVCVTVGRVQASEAEEPELPREGFIGFGRRTDGVNIVVQMFTEEKRQEIDLEGLWERILRRADRDQGSELEQEVEQNSQESSPSQIVDALSETDSRSSLPRVSNSQSAQQVRRLHTVGISPHSTAHGFSIFGMTSIQPPHAFVRRPQSTDASTKVLIEPTETQPDDLKGLQYLLKELKAMPVQTAYEALGAGLSDKTSTTFLRDFHELIPDFGRELYHFEAWMDMVVCAVQIEVPGYNIADSDLLLDEIALSGLTPSERIYKTILELRLQDISVRSSQNIPSMPQLERCIQILQEMEALDYKTLTPELMLSFHKHLLVEPSQTSDVDSVSDVQDKTPTLATQLQAQRTELRNFIAIHDLEPMDADIYLDLLRRYGSIRDWVGFHDIWHLLARLQIPRSAEHYITALNLITEAADRDMAQEALRTMTPDMVTERPPVDCVGDLARAMYACVRVAEPRVDEEEVEPGIVDAEWRRLRDWCRRGLAE
ncbi:uncharacterized protein BDZ99DRAFT_495067 [Mytilinidion resinicola]|uniref:ATPase synthesis protein 25 n=1 Tax=Mytilinidion resinicola TaxID=574789 RepID=A0A6A6Z360_9PEZI|nr:uncharacterized protein BDZ99DRAFT_495067 [Mytilinidion resinicola]KAF2815258.1 hypothetical protein BDZ99DRAFT_495067 [Mytilinidion resinicola]